MLRARRLTREVLEERLARARGQEQEIRRQIKIEFGRSSATPDEMLMMKTVLEQSLALEGSTPTGATMEEPGAHLVEELNLWPAADRISRRVREKRTLRRQP